MSPCKCEYVEEVNTMQSGVRIHKLVKRCEECEEKEKIAQEEGKKLRIKNLQEQIKLQEVDIVSAKSLGYDDVVAKKQEVLDVLRKQLSALESVEMVSEEKVETPKKRRRSSKVTEEENA